MCCGVRLPTARRPRTSWLCCRRRCERIGRTCAPSAAYAPKSIDSRVRLEDSGSVRRRRRHVARRRGACMPMTIAGRFHRRARPGAAINAPSDAGFLAAALAAVTLFSAGCEQTRPYVPPSQGHITQPPKPAAPEPVIPPPARVSAFVPPPQPTLKPQTYSVVVNEVPVKELLNALARDTRQNIDIHPTVSGLVSLNAIDETLPALLERISKQVDIRFRTEGNTIIVSPDVPYMKTYVVNYVNMQRNTTSTTGASGQIGTGPGGSGGGSGGGGGGGSGGNGGGNTSSTTVTTTSTSDFWKGLETAVRGILNSALQQSLSAEARQL